MSDLLRLVKTNIFTKEQYLLEFSDSLVKEISRFNTYLTIREVKTALKKGETIYTSFSHYKLE